SRRVLPILDVGLADAVKNGPFASTRRWSDSRTGAPSSPTAVRRQSTRSSPRPAFARASSRSSATSACSTSTVSLWFTAGVSSGRRPGSISSDTRSRSAACFATCASRHSSSGGLLLRPSGGEGVREAVLQLAGVVGHADARRDAPALAGQLEPVQLGGEGGRERRRDRPVTDAGRDLDPRVVAAEARGLLAHEERRVVCGEVGGGRVHERPVEDGLEVSAPRLERPEHVEVAKPDVEGAVPPGRQTG